MKDVKKKRKKSENTRIMEKQKHMPYVWKSKTWKSLNDVKNKTKRDITI